MKSTVTSKGQVTIPHLIREKADIHPGTQLDFQLKDNGMIIIRSISRDISNLKGSVKSKRRRPVSLKEMKKTIQNAAMEKNK